MAPRELANTICAIRSTKWAILPEYLAAIEAIAERLGDAEVLRLVESDGHIERLAASRAAAATAGAPMAGARLAMLREGAAVIPIFGPIFPRANLVSSSAGGTPLDAVMSDFRAALSSTQVERIVLLVDSPGGVVSGLAEAASAIRASKKPVTAFVTGSAASAAYWLASQAGEIVLDPCASVGSIGIVASVSRQEAPGADGRRTYEVVSSNAPHKRPDPTSADGLAQMRAELDGIEAVFVSDVARARARSPEYVRKAFGRGGLLVGARAVSAGAADRLGTLDGLFAVRSGSGAVVHLRAEVHRRKASL